MRFGVFVSCRKMRKRCSIFLFFRLFLSLSLCLFLSLFSASPSRVLSPFFKVIWILSLYCLLFGFYVSHSPVSLSLPSIHISTPCPFLPCSLSHSLSFPPFLPVSLFLSSAILISLSLSLFPHTYLTLSFSFPIPLAFSIPPFLFPRMTAQHVYNSHELSILLSLVCCIINLTLNLESLIQSDVVSEFFVKRHANCTFFFSLSLFATQKKGPIRIVEEKGE